MFSKGENRIKYECVGCVNLEPCILLVKEDDGQPTKCPYNLEDCKWQKKGHSEDLIKEIDEIVRDLIKENNEEHTRDMLHEIHKLINP